MIQNIKGATPRRIRAKIFGRFIIGRFLRIVVKTPMKTKRLCFNRHLLMEQACRLLKS
jgi:hypothetical protein